VPVVERLVCDSGQDPERRVAVAADQRGRTFAAGLQEPLHDQMGCLAHVPGPQVFENLLLLAQAETPFEQMAVGAGPEDRQRRMRDAPGRGRFDVTRRGRPFGDEVLLDRDHRRGVRRDGPVQRRRRREPGLILLVQPEGQPADQRRRQRRLAVLLARPGHHDFAAVVQQAVEEVRLLGQAMPPVAKLHPASPRLPQEQGAGFAAREDVLGHAAENQQIVMFEPGLEQPGDLDRQEAQAVGPDLDLAHQTREQRREIVERHRRQGRGGGVDLVEQVGQGDPSAGVVDGAAGRGVVERLARRRDLPGGAQGGGDLGAGDPAASRELQQAGECGGDRLDERRPVGFPARRAFVRPDSGVAFLGQPAVPGQPLCGEMSVQHLLLEIQDLAAEVLARRAEIHVRVGQHFQQSLMVQAGGRAAQQLPGEAAGSAGRQRGAAGIVQGRQSGVAQLGCDAPGQAAVGGGHGDPTAGIHAQGLDDPGRDHAALGFRIGAGDPAGKARIPEQGRDVAERGDPLAVGPQIASEFGGLIARELGQGAGGRARGMRFGVAVAERGREEARELALALDAGHHQAGRIRGGGRRTQQRRGGRGHRDESRHGQTAERGFGPRAGDGGDDPQLAIDFVPRAESAIEAPGFGHPAQIGRQQFAELALRLVGHPFRRAGIDAVAAHVVEEVHQLLGQSRRRFGVLPQPRQFRQRRGQHRRAQAVGDRGRVDRGQAVAEITQQAGGGQQSRRQHRAAAALLEHQMAQRGAGPLRGQQNQVGGHAVGVGAGVVQQQAGDGAQKGHLGSDGMDLEHVALVMDTDEMGAAGGRGTIARRIAQPRPPVKGAAVRSRAF